MIKLAEKKNIYGDNIGFVELWDNSRGNLSDETRVDVVTRVASVCFGKEESKKPENLYKRLSKESANRHSSSFEFVPVLLTSIEVQFLRELSSVVYNKTNNIYQPHCLKFSEVIMGDNGKDWYVLTNLRALLYDNEYSTQYMNTSIEGWYNNTTDIKKIFANYHLFRVKLPIFSLRQIMRMRQASYQEISRRYTSGEPEFYQFDDFDYNYSFIINEYNKLLKNGVKAERARSILPVSMYSTVWIGVMPQAFENFIKLRTDKHTQNVTRIAAEATRDLVKEEKGIEV